MITEEHALRTADAWLNTAGASRREVRHREFDLGWVVWAAPAAPERDPVTGERRPPADLGEGCGVVDRATGKLSAWSSVPVDEVIEAYRERLRPVVGPGNRLVATYLDGAGQEGRVELVSAPGLAPVELRLPAELSRLGVPAGAVRSVHTALRPATLPGGYPAVVLEREFPDAVHSCDHPYGISAAERAEGVAALTASLRPQPRPNRRPAPGPDAVVPAEPVRDVALGRRLPGVLGEVLRFDADDPLRAGLPSDTCATLTWAGLPVEVPLLFTADRTDPPPAGGLFADLRTALTAAGSTLDPQVLEVLAGWNRIGSDGLCVIAVQREGQEAGSVWAVHPRTGSGRFVNSSLSGYLRSLLLVAEARAAMVGLDPIAAGTAVAGLQEALVAVDPAVFRAESAWWSVLVEQLWHGLL
ncbi:SUKH-4 family immunity protein [Kitasatospora griseola]|uniref:SUKH-4 family immunity protein n=1 Tax=Kitasatospora griseola TaxID=2064 RepID=UPI0038556891